MKRVCQIIVLILVLIAFPVYALAADLIIDEATENSNQIVAVSLRGCEDAVAIQFTLDYDANKVELLSSSFGEILDGKTPPVINTNIKGQILFLWDDLNPIGGNGELFKVTFKPLETNARASMSFNQSAEFIIVDQNYNNIEVNAVINSVATTEPKPTPTIPAAMPTKGENNGLTLDKNEANLEPGDELILSISENDNVKWTSNNEAIVSVNNGKVFAASEGNAIITVYSDNGYATCLINVSKFDGSIWIWIVAGLIVVFALGAGYYFMVYKKH